MKPLTFGSLFAGIGGFDLGFERAGMQCKWQCEIDPYCQRVLAKHWPDVRRWDDVRTFPPSHPADWRVDVICGGFPCQDVSTVGPKAGINGSRSGLWGEFQRIIRVVRPAIVVVENVPGLLDRGMGRVLGDLAAIGFDAEWSVLSACAMGFPHTRERVFIVGYPAKESARNIGGHRAPRRRMQVSGKRSGDARFSWSDQPGVQRTAYGVPRGMDRTGAVGNAVVPQVAEWIGRRIVEACQD